MPGDKTGAAAGMYSTSRYLGSVIGSSVLALLFVHKPGVGDAGLFVGLFAGLSVAAALGILANARVATRR